ncbi:MAG: hypothetical protein MRY49_00450 [Candidatus Pacebacteria bacterium]|nr:hypothetical protein [Candidatus Paceibacterota bacterium]
MSGLLESVLDFVFPKEKIISDMESMDASDLRKFLPRSPNNSCLFNSKYPEVRLLKKEVFERKNKKISFACAEILSENILDRIWEYQTFEPKLRFSLISDKKQRLVADYINKMIPHIGYCPDNIKTIDPGKIRNCVVFVLENDIDKIVPIVARYNPKEIVSLSIAD